MSGLTAWQFLIDLGHDHPSPFQGARHRPTALGGDTTVLVNGAAGGVGHLALQLDKWKGPTSSPWPPAPMRRSCARSAPTGSSTTPRTAPRTSPGTDLVLDAVGGPRSRRFLRTLRRGGSLYPVYFGEFDDAESEALGVTVTGTQVRSNGTQLAEPGRLLDAGTLRVAIDSSFTLADAPAAHERAARGHIRGKIVLTVAQRAAGRRTLRT